MPWHKGASVIRWLTDRSWRLSKIPDDRFLLAYWKPTFGTLYHVGIYEKWIKILSEATDDEHIVKVNPSVWIRLFYKIVPKVPKVPKSQSPISALYFVNIMITHWYIIYYRKWRIILGLWDFGTFGTILLIIFNHLHTPFH